VAACRIACGGDDVINDEVDAATIATCEGELLLARWSYTSNSSDDISHSVYSWGQLMLRGDGVLFERKFLGPGEYDPWREGRGGGLFTVDEVERMYGGPDSKTYIVRIVLPPAGPVTDPGNLPAEYHSDIDGDRYIIIDVEEADLSGWSIEVGQDEAWRRQAGFGGWTPARDDSTSRREFDREHAWYRSGKGSPWGYLKLSQDRTEYPWSALVGHGERVIRWIGPDGATREPKALSRKTEPMSPDSSSRIEMSWRPDTYFWPPGLEKQLLAKVKGAARRAALQRLIDEGRLVEIPDYLATAGLSDDERTEIGRIHPHFMGGEYLPDQDEDEIAIARIEINSTTGDVTSVYAHQDGSTIRYRVVDEYGGETLHGTTECTSSRPLTLGEVEEFFLGAWPFFEVLAMNFEDDTEQMLGFFHGASQFYPEFDQLLRERVIAAYPESAQAEEEADSDDERVTLGDKEIPGGGSPDDDVVPAELDQRPMNHRFAIFPAGSVVSIEQANDLIHAMGAQSDGEPSPEIRDLVDEVLESSEWTFALTRPAASQGVIIATHRPEDGLLRFLLNWTMLRGLAVYDIELFRLYDPSGRVDVEVSLSGDLKLPYLTPALLRDLVLRPTWPDPEYPYFIVGGDGEFIQTYRDEDGKYQLEHRASGSDAQFAIRTPDTWLVADVMWAWATHDESWRTAVPWGRLELEDEDAEVDTADEASAEPADDGIYVDNNSDRELTFEDTGGEPFLAYHAGNADNDKDAEGRLIPTGWVLHVDEDESFVTEVLDFDSLDEALVRATEHLGKSLPDSSSRPGVPMNEDEAPKRAHVFLHRGDLPVDSYGHEHDLTVSASYSVADGLTVKRSDSTQWPMDDLEDLWQVAPEHIGDLREALGEVGNEDLLDLLAQRYAEGNMSTHLSGWFDTHGVKYSFVSRSLPN
jgi:hypothetical protein